MVTGPPFNAHYVRNTQLNKRTMHILVYLQHTSWPSILHLWWRCFKLCCSHWHDFIQGHNGSNYNSGHSGRKQWPPILWKIQWLKFKMLQLHSKTCQIVHLGLKIYLCTWFFHNAYIVLGWELSLWTQSVLFMKNQPSYKSPTTMEIISWVLLKGT